MKCFKRRYGEGVQGDVTAAHSLAVWVQAVCFCTVYVCSWREEGEGLTLCYCNIKIPGGEVLQLVLVQACLVWWPRGLLFPKHEPKSCSEKYRLKVGHTFSLTPFWSPNNIVQSGQSMPMK